MTDRLIIVRAGDNSCHHQWGDGNWDIINSYYGENPPSEAIHIKGGKWDGIYETFLKKPELLEKYKTIWLPDDDIETNASDIETMFKIHQQYGLELSQPALSYDSYAWFNYLFQNKNFILRYTNFVEAMLPCFSVRLLKNILPMFKNNRTGYMLDKVWHRFADKIFCGAAIIDEVAMRHSRELNPGILDKAYTSRPLKVGEIDKSSQAADYEKVKHLIPARKKRHPLCYGAILKNGEKIMGEFRLARFFLSPFNRKQIRYQLTNHVELSKLRMRESS